MAGSLSRPAEILQRLIQCASVTPEEGGALDVLETVLKPMGFETHRMTFSDENTADVQNLYARLGTAAPNFCFAGHTDVVPPGDETSWTSPPFQGVVEDGVMTGRGAVDMKGGIACFIAAVEQYLANHGELQGSICLLITGDEEGPSINGTIKLLEWAEARGEKLDGCIVGEPTNPERLGDAIKIGRRGSLTGKITVTGIQGHAAYPHLADNPVRGIVALCQELMAAPFDHGTDNFQPTNLEVTTIDTGNSAANVIAGSSRATFNVRFNDTWSVETLKAEIIARLGRGAASQTLRDRRQTVTYQVEWPDRASPVFLTRDNTLVNTLSGAVEAVTGLSPELSTGGGTSDARFIKDYCPVVEFGLVGQTMHQVDERVSLDDLDRLTEIYQGFLLQYFS